MYSLKISLANMSQLLKSQVEYEISLTKHELRVVPNVESIDSLFATFSAFEADNGYLVHVEIDGKINIFDQSSSEYRKIDIFDQDDVLVSDDKEQTDIDIDRGECEFYPIVLALFYSAVPLRYSSKPIEVEKSADYTLMSEDSYDQNHDKSREDERGLNPFAKLDIDEFE